MADLGKPAPRTIEDEAPESASSSRSDISESTLLDGRLRLRQFRTGHKAGTDAVLLAACTPAWTEGLVIDLGCGSGAVGLMAALRAHLARIVLIDNDPRSLGLVQDNISLNALRARAEVRPADILDFKRGDLANLRGQADIVLTNPPFLDENQFRTSPDPDRRAAHVMPAGGLDKWIETGRRLARPNGRLILIHRADALPHILRCSALSHGAVMIMPIHAKASETAIRMLVSVTFGSKAPFQMAPSLILHEADGSFTSEASAIHLGRAGLGL